MKAVVTSTRTYNALRELIRATDPGGSISNSYRADRQPKSTTVLGNVVAVFEYDRYGRQTQLTDPSAGTLSYGYDVGGYRNMVTKTRNQVSVTTSITNNKYGNPLTVQRPEFSTTYTYNDAQTIASIVSTNNTKQSFSYDDFGRVTSQTDELGGEKLEKAYTYTGNRLATTSYK